MSNKPLQLNDIINNSKYYEVIRQKSCTVPNREEFIMEVANSNILLALSCKQQSFLPEDLLVAKLISKAVDNIVKYENTVEVYRSFIFLANLYKLDFIEQYIRNVPSIAHHEFLNTVLLQPYCENSFSFLFNAVNLIRNERNEKRIDENIFYQQSNTLLYEPNFNSN
jgi:hypothetical protein